jgi:site-specific recombinase XerD/ribosomal protein L40E
MGIDIHTYGARINAALRIIENGNLTESSRADLLEFYEFLVANSLSRGRILKYLYHLLKIERWLNKPFKEATKKDIIKLVQIIETQDYTAHTKHDYKIVVKRFYQWLRSSDDYPEEVRWIKSTIKKNDLMIPEELLTIEEVNKQIETTDHPRNKAMISALYESGCRPSEFLSFCIKHVVFDKYGVQLTIPKGKTGMRRIRLVASVPHLAAWIEMHPLRDNPNASLWIAIGTRNRNKPILYRTFVQHLVEIGQKAGIKKRMYPYLFRHTRATHMANHLTESQMCQYFGWVQGSKMPRTYVHLSGRDLDGPILQMHGIKIEEKKKDDFTVKKCQRCEKINPPAGKICSRCGSPLDANEAMKLEKEQEQVNIKMKATIKYLLMNPKTRNSTIEIMNQVNYEFPEYNNMPKERLT